MPKLTVTEYDALSSDDKKEYDKAEAEREREEQSQLPYTWKQTLQDVTLVIPVPRGSKAKELTVEINKTKLKVGLKGKEPILEGQLCKDIKEEDSTWNLDEQKEIRVRLKKVDQMTWWENVLAHHPKINTHHCSPTVLLTNDDGPCSSSESPFIHSFTRHLRSAFLGPSPDKLRVVIPDSQKSWIGKAYIIKDTISLQYYDPETSTSSPTPLVSPGREQWILLSGTPATCSNIALFNLFPGEIDLVISGPNYGRNTSSAFSLSSGTIGASLDAALSNHRTIALSYGVFERPVSEEILNAANEIAVKIIKQLWHCGFNQANDGGAHVDVYSVNIPLVPAILNDPQVTWTTESNTRYGRLFLPASGLLPTAPAEIDEASVSSAPLPSSLDELDTVSAGHPAHFIFKPDISLLIDPNSTHHPVGTDAWALNRGMCTVTPLRAAFAGARRPPDIDEVELNGLKVWKL